VKDRESVALQRHDLWRTNGLSPAAPEG